MRVCCKNRCNLKVSQTPMRIFYNDQRNNDLWWHDSYSMTKKCRGFITCHPAEPDRTACSMTALSCPHVGLSQQATSYTQLFVSSGYCPLTVTSDSLHDDVCSSVVVLGCVLRALTNLHFVSPRIVLIPLSRWCTACLIIGGTHSILVSSFLKAFPRKFPNEIVIQLHNPPVTDVQGKSRSTMT